MQRLCSSKHTHACKHKHLPPPTAPPVTMAAGTAQTPMNDTQWGWRSEDSKPASLCSPPRAGLDRDSACWEAPAWLNTLTATAHSCHRARYTCADCEGGASSEAVPAIIPQACPATEPPHAMPDSLQRLGCSDLMCLPCRMSLLQ